MLVRPHLGSLATHRAQMVLPGPYGTPDRTRWDGELTRFLNEVVLANASPRDLDAAFPFRYRMYDGVALDDAQATRRNSWGPRMYSRPGSALARHVEGLVDAHEKESGFQRVVSLGMIESGKDFEHSCAAALKDLGWETRVVSASADQGVDVIARRNGWVVAIQCKRYHRSVGNSAVQQVTAGRLFHRANAAAVISTAPYTRAARSLAATTRVALLAHTDLAELERLLIEAGCGASET